MKITAENKEMAKKNGKESIVSKVKRFTTSLCVSLMMLFSGAGLCLAAPGDPADITTKFARLLDIVYLATTMLGTISLIFGVIKLFQSFQDHDGNSRNQGVFTVVLGIVLIAMKSVVAALIG
ncbi:MAG: hypothetical protein RR162_02630 [Oscillospiraceae bacterium]